MCEPLKAAGVGAAHERPWEPPEGGGDLHQPKLVEAIVFLLLPSNVFPDHAFVSTDGRHKVSARPEVLADEIPLPLSERPRDVNRALSLDVPDHLRDRVLRRN